MNQAMKDHVKLLLEYEGATPESREIESVWAIPVKEGLVVDNIPFRAKGIALGDIVRAEKDDDGLFHFSSLVAPSGHSTIHLWFSKEYESLVAAIRRQLRDMGCTSELSDLPRLVAVDIPPIVPYGVIREFFNQQERDGIFEYEEACLGQD